MCANESRSLTQNRNRQCAVLYQSKNVWEKHSTFALVLVVKVVNGKINTSLAKRMGYIRAD